MVSYSMPEVQRVLGISLAELKRLVRAELLPEFDTADGHPEIYCERSDVGKGGGRRWTPLGLFRLFVTRYLLKIGLTHRPIIQAMTFLFEGVTSDGGPLPRSYDESVKMIRRKFIKAEGERRYIVISLGHLSEVGRDGECTALAEVEVTGRKDPEPAQPGHLVLPVGQIVMAIRLLLRAAGLSMADFRLDESG